MARGDDGCLPIHFAVKYRPDALRGETEMSPERKFFGV